MRNTARLLSFIAAGLLLVPGAAAVSFDWVTIDRPGNACDPQSFDCPGGVDYYYKIASYEVTNAEYAEFLNAKAASDPLGLYNIGMAGTHGGITRGGSPGTYTYSVVSGREDWPVSRVSFFDALRFVNWLSNGQGNGDTETGSYTLLGGTATPSNELVERNPGATIFVASSDEWYKAAFYDTDAGTYFDYPTGTDDQVSCSGPTAAANSANCGGAVGTLTPAGSYPASPSPNGTFDQGGNVEEWCEEVVILEQRAIRGGYFNTPAHRMVSTVSDYDDPWHESAVLGFRVAALADDPAGEGCGDAICEDPENALNCAVDCPDVCGDGLCTGDEDVLSCPGECPDVCGDGVCTGSEDSTTCAGDCGSACGDGVCNGDEGTANCADDCGTDCGDGACNGGESSATCVPDCGVVCGDGYCANGESCPADCGPECGDGVCESGETQSSCPDDCAPQCLPRRSSCSSDSQCCSGDCRRGRCR